MSLLLPLTAAAPADVEALLDRAFGSDRRTRTAYRLRTGLAPIAGMSFAARGADGALLGTLQSWPLVLEAPDGALSPLAMLGPVAVLPEAQGRGVGRSMMTAALGAADRLGEGALMLIGDPEYYGRFFGFSAGPTADWVLPGPVDRHRLLARLAPGVTLPRAGTLRPNPGSTARARKASALAAPLS